MGRPKKITPTVEKAPNRYTGGIDLLPEHHLPWSFFLDKFLHLANIFGYTKIEAPLFEHARLYKTWEQGGERKAVAMADIKGATAAMRPTHLFSLARMYLEHRLYERERISKWFYHAPIMYSEPTGELKQSVEFGLQIFGGLTPIADSQMINMLMRLFNEAGIPNLSLEINNSGCLECLPGYRDVLGGYFKEHKYDLCDNCLSYLEKNNPLRVLTCENLDCNTVITEAPTALDYICDNCRKHFISVLEGLDELNIAYNLNQKVVGKPWSRRSIFEIHSRIEGKDIVLGRGGHFDDLIQSLGGPITQSLGFIGKMESVLEAINLSNVKFATTQKVDVYLVPLGELACKKTLRLFTELWNHGIVASEFMGVGSIKTQLKLAESNKVDIALLIGQKEAREGTVILRDVRSGMQEIFVTERIVDEVKKRLGR
jgi:histidyl-tRNA synthetase